MRRMAHKELQRILPTLDQNQNLFQPPAAGLMTQHQDVFFLILGHTLPRASCAVPYILHVHSFRHFSYLGFGEPSLLCRLITFLLASSLLVYRYLDITLDG